MSTTTTDYLWELRLPCDIDSECYHKVCHVCERPIRTTGQRQSKHPEARHGHITNRLCYRCDIEGHEPYVRKKPAPKPKPDPLAQNESHILLSDKEMTRIRRNNPHIFYWHIARRRRLNARMPVLDEKPACSIEGCTKDAWSRGMCNTHYRRVLRHGDPHKLNYSRKDQTA